MDSDFRMGTRELQKGPRSCADQGSDRRRSWLRALCGTVAVAATLGAVAGNALSQAGDGYIGTEGSDVQQGTPSADVMDGAGGDDFLRGLDGGDTLNGGDGTDALIGDETAGTTTCCFDVLSGGAGADEVTGGSGDDQISGGDGDDHLGATDMTSQGGILSTEDGADTIDAGTGEDTVNAGPGADTVTPGAGHDVVITGPLTESSNDVITEGPGSDTIDGGGGGFDAIHYSQLTDPIVVNPGTEPSTYTVDSYLNPEETVRDEDRLVRIERITGTHASAGDEMYGSRTTDWFEGGDGPDILMTSGGGDTMFGDAGDDTLHPGAGVDTAYGGDGSDTASYRLASVPITASLAAGTAEGEGSDSLYGIENLTGSNQNDQLTGSDGPNTLAGYTSSNGGVDQLVGLGDSDLLKVRDNSGGDSVDCGDGTGDVAEVDPSDTVVGGCETVRDGVRPPTPLDLAVTPVSPSTDSSPQVRGTLTGGASVSQVRIFIGECSGTPAATGTAAEFTGNGITVPVPENQTSVLRAQSVDAGNEESFCESNGVTYTEESVAPSAPQLTSTVPASPANQNSPRIKGTAEAGSTVKLYTNATCTGIPRASGPASQLFGTGIAATVPNNSTTAFRATATDAAGNVSACSGPRIYIEDSAPPPPPTLTGTSPASPGKSSTPKIKGSAAAGSTVRLFTSADCSGSPVATGSTAALASPGIAATVSKRKTHFRATATDAAGNASGCSDSITYVKKRRR